NLSEGLFCPAWWHLLATVVLGGRTMSVPLHRTGRRSVFAREHQGWSSVPSNVSSLGLPTLTGLIDFAGLCGIAFCVGAGAALGLKDSHSGEMKAIARTEAKPQVVNQSRKDDRLQATVVDAPRSANPQDGFGTWEVGGALIAVITVRDANGRLVFELDPLRRT